MEAAGKRWVQHPSQKNHFVLWGIGDIHLGCPGCDLKRVKRDIAAIAADPYSLWLGLGDYADYISPRDKRFTADHLDDEAKLNIGRLGRYYMEEIRDLFRPIAGRCLGLLLGNHEHKYFADNNQEDGHAWLCEELGVPNLRYSSIFDLVFVRRPCGGPKLIPARGTTADSKSEVFRVYAHHGSGGATTPGGKLNTLIKHMQMVPEADIVLIGHVHDQKGQRMVTLGANADCSEIVERQRVGVICGSYLKTYQSGHTSYGEMKGYAPTSLGPAKVQIAPSRREIRGEV